MKDYKITILELFNHIVTSHPELRKNLEDLIFKDQEINTSDVKFLLELNSKTLSKSKSQLRQDLFVLFQLNNKRKGFFVEFGATNGIDLSNTHLLEKEYEWDGILAEPAKCWHEDLKNNRNCHIEHNCVWKDSTSTLSFNEVAFAELSTINEYSSSDGHSQARNHGKTYDVQSISLIDLLKKYNAPREIDYLSIDTEGSEYEILSHFDFSRYSFKVITCEHNYTPMREKIFQLLTQNGYIRVHQKISQFDDWYIKEKIATPVNQ